MLTVVLGRIAKRLKQTKCPSMDKWIMKMGLYIQCDIMQP